MLSGQHHRAAKWFTTASSSPPHVAPGTAAPRARQCPANPKSALPHKQRSASAAATSSDADTLRATAWSSSHGLRPPLCFQQSGFTRSALRVCQSERWSAVTKGHASLRLVLTCDSGPLTGSHTLRFYITPHLQKCPASRSQARLVAGHRFAPFGFCKQALCKVSALGGGPWPQTRGPFPASFLCPGPAAWFACVSVWSGAPRSVFSQRASPGSSVLAPARPVARSLRSHRPRPARPPPKGAPSGRGGSWSWRTAVVHQQPGPPRPSGAAARHNYLSGRSPCLKRQVTTMLFCHRIDVAIHVVCAVITIKETTCVEP